MTTPQEVLAGVPLFSMLPKEEVATLARRAHELTIPAGTVVTDMDQVGVSFGAGGHVPAHARPASACRRK
jgi:hypothetical protein